ncbi:MAG: hypothetical protein Q9216_004365 [Gyalolechia sp. 2 TL-2023]
MTSNRNDDWPFTATVTDREDPPSPKRYVDPQSWSEWNEDFAQTTIDSYLANSLSPDETALALTAPITNFLSSGLAATDDTPEESDIWSAMLATARKHTHDSPAIPALVALLAAIKAIPKEKQLRHAGETYWVDLPQLGLEVRENWNRQIREQDGSSGQRNSWACTAEEWTSMHAFVAQFTVAGVRDSRAYCTWALRDALEDVPGQRSSVGHITNLDHRVPAAAVWIFVAGEVMYTEWLGWGVEEPEISGGSGGQLWRRKGLGPKRWAFWKERFEWVGRQGEVEVKEETRGFARKAAQRMEEVEKMEVPRKEN